MAQQSISSANTSDLTNSMIDYSVSTRNTDGATGFIETKYTTEWAKWHGYYRGIPEIQAVVDAKARWTVGKGFEADEKTKQMLSKIKGFGKDTFNSLLYNLCRTYTIGGDSYAEIIKDKAGRLINLKPLNPASITIVVDKFGILTRYEQTSNTANGGKIIFQPNQILHFAWNRIADEIHGISTIEKLTTIILSRNEALDDLKTVFHRYVSPIQIWELDTDNESEISSFKSKVETAFKYKENIFIPKDTVKLSDRLSIPQYSTLDPLPYLRLLQKFFIIAEGVPEVIMGWGEETTEATSKIIYLAFQQMIEHNQLFIQDTLKAQLGIEINLVFPASIEPDLISNQKKESSLTTMGVNPTKDQK